MSNEGLVLAFAQVESTTNLTHEVFRIPEWGTSMPKAPRPTHGRTKAKVAAKPRPGQRSTAKRARKTKQSAFLEAFRGTGTINGAARKTHIDHGSHYRWLQQDPEYAAAFEEANEDAADELEQEARRRALDGIDEPVYYRGERVGSIRKYSDHLLMLLLMAKRPEQFRERVDVTSTVDHGVVIDPKILKTLTDAELEIARALGRKLTGPREKPAP